MSRRSTLRAALMLGLALAPVARAEPPAQVQVEVKFLLDDIAASGCEFYRNGTWHDSKTAQGHLRDKYNYLGDRIHTTEDFIDKAASESSFSGKPYQVKCNGGAAVTSNQWLRAELLRFRTPK